jgi:hypothetical protein
LSFFSSTAPFLLPFSLWPSSLPLYLSIVQIWGFFRSEIIVNLWLVSMLNYGNYFSRLF